MDFCIICGRKTDELYDNMCRDCYIKNRALIEMPREVDIIMCPVCLAYRYRGKWMRGEGGVTERVKEAIGKLLLAKSNIYAKAIKDFQLQILRGGERIPEFKSATLLVKAYVLGYTDPRVGNYSNECEVIVHLKWKYCPSCLKVKIGKEEAVVQIRAMDRKLSEREKERIANSLERLIGEMYQTDPEAVVLDYTEEEGGMDIKLPSKRVARVIATYLQREYLATVKETFKVVGRDKGREKTRETISVRLPNFTMGDIIEVNGRHFLIKDIRGGRVYALDLARGIPITLKGNDVKRASPIAYETVPAMVISENNGYVMLMRLDDYKIVELKKEDMRIAKLKEGESVDLIVTGNRLYLVKS